MKRTLSVTVVIPTLGKYSLLKESLKSILHQSYFPDQVVVVDNGINRCSDAGFFDKYEKNLNIRFIRHTRKSIPEARNRGLEIASSDIVVFTDDDCIFDKEWIKNLIQPFVSNPHIGIVGGEILTEAYSKSKVDNYFVDMKMSRVGIASDIRWKKGYVPGEVFVNTGFAIHPFFTAANMAVRKSIFDTIGRFDPDFKTNEDLEFCIRAAKNGWRLFFEPKAIVVHKPPRTLKRILRSWYDYGVYHGPLFRKYNDRTTEIYIYKSWDQGAYPNFLHFLFKTPFNAVIFINSFHLMNITLILAIIFKILSYNNFFILFISLSLLSLFRYLWLRLDTIYQPRIFFYLAINYLLNLSYCFGAFIGGLKTGMLYLEATVDEVR